jgi:hypothetical protein
MNSRMDRDIEDFIQAVETDTVLKAVDEALAKVSASGRNIIQVDDVRDMLLDIRGAVVKKVTVT